MSTTRPMATESPQIPTMRRIESDVTRWIPRYRL
jgi:hypothetical protein